MKHDLTAQGKRVILNWLTKGYYDIDELNQIGDTTNEESLEDIENEIIRLSKLDPILLAKQMRSSGICQGCSMIDKYTKTE